MQTYYNQARGGFWPFPFGPGNPPAKSDEYRDGGSTEYVDAVTRLIEPTEYSGARMLDGTAGRGEVLAYLAERWNLTPYAVEIERYRAQKAIDRFGIHQAIQDSLLKAHITPGAFGLVWNNPPYTTEEGFDGRKKRVEQKFLEYNWRFVQRDGGLHIWVVYAHHLKNEDAAYSIVANSRRYQVYRVPSPHLGAYQQILVVCEQGDPGLDHPEREAQRLAEIASANYRIAYYDFDRLSEVPSDEDYEVLWPSIMDVTEPEFVIPRPAEHRQKRFRFSPQHITPALLVQSVKAAGLHTSKAFVDMLTPEPINRVRQSLVQPRTRQYAGLLAAGLFNGLDLDTNDGRAIVRSVVRHVETKVDSVEDEETGRVVEEVYRQVPQTTITLLFESGEIRNITGDDALAGFIRGHKSALIAYIQDTIQPKYRFDFLGGRLARFIKGLRLHKDEGTYALYPPQQHVVAAAFSHLEEARALTVSGETGIGKTVMLSALMEAMKFRSPDDEEYHNLYYRLKRSRKGMRPDQFNVVICPPHLVDKWCREIEGLHTGAYVVGIKSGTGRQPVEEVRAFIDDLDNQPADALKVLVISREMAKVAEPAVKGKKAWAAAYDIRHQRRRFVNDDGEWEVKTKATPICPTTGLEVIDRYYKNGARKHVPAARMRRRRHFRGLRPGHSRERHVGKARFEGDEQLLSRFERYQEEGIKDPRFGWPEYQRKLREQRLAYEEKHALNHPLWQAQRTSSSPERLTKTPVAKLLQKRMGASVPVVPLPDLAAEHLEEHEYIPTRNPRAPFGGVARYLAQRYRERIYMVVFDEFHEYANPGSAQGEAMMRLANAAAKIVGITGTLYGGKASSIYTLEFVTNPRVRFAYPWDEHGRTGWVKKMGVLESTVKYGDPKAGEDGATTSKKVTAGAPREVPGASPALLGELVDHTIFFGIEDLGKAMPDLEEHGSPIPMDDDMAAIYAETDKALYDYLTHCRLEGDNSFLGRYFQTMLNWANYPFKTYKVVHNTTIVDPVTEEKQRVSRVVYTIPPLDPDELTAKERKLVDRVQAELDEGRGVCVFVRQTGQPNRSTAKRLKRVVGDHVKGAKPVVLTSRVKTGEREAWIEAHKDHNILICNPNLVRTGFDLIHWPTLVFYELDYSLYTMDQAAGRHRRPNQTRDCRTFWLFYHRGFQQERGEDDQFHEVLDEDGNPIPRADTMEARGIVLVDKKRKAANFLYGKAGGSLSTLTSGSGGSLTEELARSIDEEAVIDARALFQQAARSEVDDEDRPDWYVEEEDEVQEEMTPEPEPVCEPEPVPSLAVAVVPSPSSNGHTMKAVFTPAFIEDDPEPEPQPKSQPTEPKRRRRIEANDATGVIQLNLFD